MKSIIHHISSCSSISFIYVILAYISSAAHCGPPPPCGLYGAKPCQFVPAPPGQTPACARPGKTYCEHVDNYPTYLIKHLVHKWGYEAKNLLIDETWDDFAALVWRDTPIFFDPSYIFPHRHHFGSNGGGGAAGRGGIDFHGYNYETPSGLGGTASGAAAGKYNEDTYVVTKQQPTETPTFLLYAGRKNQLKTTPNNPTLWLKRIVRDLSHNALAANISTNAVEITLGESASPATAAETQKETSPGSTRDVSINMDLMDIVERSQRVKRQSPGRSTLCQTTSQFITPQAALNARGNWMFVVNEPSTARQQVKAELCASSTCSNLCQLPLGYNSRCEQKFVQKRLIALQASGQNLYTDTFWFPSCCVCTISGN